MPRENARLAKLSSILTMAAHSEEFASRGQKYQTCLILSSRPREANFSPKFTRTREETCAAGLCFVRLVIALLRESHSREVQSKNK